MSDDELTVDPEQEPLLSDPYWAKLHKVLIVLAAFMLLWLVLEATALFPFILIKWGWR
jgi:hypothetical protein